MCVLNVCSKAPELKKRLKDLVRQRDDAGDPALSTGHSKDRMTGEFAMDIGMSLCVCGSVLMCVRVCVNGA